LLTSNHDNSVFTQKTDPFKAENVNGTVLSEIMIGTNLTEDQQTQVTNLLLEHADYFALPMSKVTAVERAAHKVNQRPLSGPQKEYFNEVLDKMLDAGIITPIDHKNVECCGATTLMQKAHDGGSLTIEELQHQLNNKCIMAGFPTAFEGLPPQHTGQETKDVKEHQNKWYICQDFPDLNKVTKVPPLPQGDIQAKQQCLSGHWWANMFDFAAGFYAYKISAEDQPYICFYVEGWGYLCYKHMLFGLTGAPLTFAKMTAQALGDLVGTLFKLSVNDGGLAGDDFNITLNNIKIILTCV
jgi:hypothetical protein